MTDDSDCSCTCSSSKSTPTLRTCKSCGNNNICEDGLCNLCSRQLVSNNDLVSYIYKISVDGGAGAPPRPNMSQVTYPSKSPSRSPKSPSPKNSKGNRKSHPNSGSPSGSDTSSPKNPSRVGSGSPSKPFGESNSPPKSQVGIPPTLSPSKNKSIPGVGPSNPALDPSNPGLICCPCLRSGPFPPYIPGPLPCNTEIASHTNCIFSKDPSKPSKKPCEACRVNYLCQNVICKIIRENREACLQKKEEQARKLDPNDSNIVFDMTPECGVPLWKPWHSGLPGNICNQRPRMSPKTSQSKQASPKQSGMKQMDSQAQCPYPRTCSFSCPPQCPPPCPTPQCPPRPCCDTVIPTSKCESPPNPCSCVDDLGYVLEEEFYEVRPKKSCKKKEGVISSSEEPSPTSGDSSSDDMKESPSKKKARINETGKSTRATSKYNSKEPSRATSSKWPRKPTGWKKGSRTAGESGRPSASPSKSRSPSRNVRSVSPSKIPFSESPSKTPGSRLSSSSGSGSRKRKRSSHHKKKHSQRHGREHEVDVNMNMEHRNNLSKDPSCIEDGNKKLAPVPRKDGGWPLVATNSQGFTPSKKWQAHPDGSPSKTKKRSDSSHRKTKTSKSKTKKT